MPERSQACQGPIAVHVLRVHRAPSGGRHRRLDRHRRGRSGQRSHAIPDRPLRSRVDLTHVILMCPARRSRSRVRGNRSWVGHSMRLQPSGPARARASSLSLSAGPMSERCLVAAAGGFSVGRQSSGGSSRRGARFPRTRPVPLVRRHARPRRCGVVADVSKRSTPTTTVISRRSSPMCSFEGPRTPTSGCHKWSRPSRQTPRSAWEPYALSARVEPSPSLTGTVPSRSLSCRGAARSMRRCCRSTPCVAGRRRSMPRQRARGRVTGRPQAPW